MLKSFLGWLDEFVLDRGLIGLASGVLGILAFGGTLSVIFGNITIRAAIIIAVLLANLAFIALLIASRAESRKRVKRAERLLARYCTSINEILVQSWRFVSYHVTYDIGARGDTKQTVKMRLVVESEELQFFRARIGPGWEQPTRMRSKVKAEVVSLLADGVGGVRWDLTSSWLPDGRLEILAHCLNPAPKGTEIALQLHLDWPRKCAPLVRDREPDNFLLGFTRPLKEMSQILTLPRGAEARYELVNFDPSDDFTVESEEIAGRRQQITLRANGLQPGKKRGLRVDLLKRPSIKND